MKIKREDTVLFRTLDKLLLKESNHPIIKRFIHLGVPYSWIDKQLSIPRGSFSHWVAGRGCPTSMLTKMEALEKELIKGLMTYSKNNSNEHRHVINMNLLIGIYGEAWIDKVVNDKDGNKENEQDKFTFHVNASDGKPIFGSQCPENTD